MEDFRILDIAVVWTLAQAKGVIIRRRRLHKAHFGCGV